MQIATERLLRIQVFADRLGISLSTARNLSYDRKITTCRMGKLLMVPASEVDRLIQANLQPRATETVAA